MRTFNFKLISRIFGLLLLIESVFMFIAGIVSLIYNEREIVTFAITTSITIIAGGFLAYKGRGFDQQMGKREGFFIVAVSWIIFSFFGMLPLDRKSTRLTSIHITRSRMPSPA